MEPVDETITFARRAVVSRQLFFSHRKARVMFGLGGLDVLLSFIFAVLPDDRTSDESRAYGIFVAQAVLAWMNVVASAALLTVVYVTYSVPRRELTFERQSRIGSLAIVKVGQILSNIALLGYPTPTRQFFALTLALLGLAQVSFALYVVRAARELFTRRIRPPLVIKALLDMKGESIGAGKQIADPLTLGMLERLEGIVKIRHQMKFSVRSGRAYLVFGVALLLVFSIFQWSWEFAKVLTYQNRFFSKAQISAIDASSNLHMYWPSYARAAGVAGVDDAWSLHPGGAGCQDSGSCRYPRDGANSAPYPLPSAGARVVLVVLGGLSAEAEYLDFLRFRQRPGWSADGIELLMRSQIPTNAVPNWIATLTGITPDLVGVLGNRNIGTTAYDNIFRMMRRFSDAWHTDRPSQYAYP